MMWKEIELKKYIYSIFIVLIGNTINYIVSHFTTSFAIQNFISFMTGVIFMTYMWECSEKETIDKLNNIKKGGQLSWIKKL